MAKILFFFTVNLSLAGENSQGDKRDMKRMWEERFPHFLLELAVNQNLCEGKMSGASSSGAL